LGCSFVSIDPNPKGFASAGFALVPNEKDGKAGLSSAFFSDPNPKVTLLSTGLASPK
jgi:hypothetical protein